MGKQKECVKVCKVEVCMGESKHKCINRNCEKQRFFYKKKMVGLKLHSMSWCHVVSKTGYLALSLLNR
jgi:hypothetical protein